MVRTIDRKPVPRAAPQSAARIIESGSLDITTLVAAVEGRLDEDAFPVTLSGPQWQTLASAMQRRELRPGDLLLRCGEAAARAFFVERGQLQVYVTRGHRATTLHAGAVVGEAGLFGAAPCTALRSAISVEPRPIIVTDCMAT